MTVVKYVPMSSENFPKKKKSSELWGKCGTSETYKQKEEKNFQLTKKIIISA